MKKYIDFINENIAHGDPHKSDNMEFDFFIDLSDYTEYKIKMAIKEFNKYVTLEEYNINGLMLFDKDKKTYINNKVEYVWYVKFFESMGNSFITRNTINFKKMTKNNVRNNDIIITLDYFIEYGIKGVVQYLELQKDINKYNI